MKILSSIAPIILVTAVVFGMPGRCAHAQEALDSITLSEALQIAESDNPDLNAMKSFRDVAAAKVRETKSDYLPRISISAGYTRYEEDNIVVPIHKAGVFPPLDNGIYENVALLSVPIFNGGRTSSAHSAAQSAVHERDAQIDLVNTNLIAAVGHIYIRARELDDRLDLITSRIGLLGRRYHELTALEQEGRIAPSDKLLVESEIENAYSDSLDIESHRRELSITLGQLLGREKPLMPNTELLPRSSDNKHLPSPDSFFEESNKITAPELRIADAQLDRMEALKDMSIRSFWPEISGIALYNSRSGNDLDFINEWAAGIRIQFPLFDGGKRYAGISAAKASLRAAQKQQDSERQKLVSRLEMEQNNLETARLQSERLGNAVRSKASSIEGQRELHREGRLQLSTLLTQENELLQLQFQERVVLYKEISSLIRHHSIRGTLTPDHVERLVRRLP